MIRKARSVVAASLGTLALSIGLAISAPAAVAEAPDQQRVTASEVGIETHANSCSTVLYRNGLERNCSVRSGWQMRSYLRCSNGFTYYTSWVGAGHWYIAQVCPSGRTRTGSGTQWR